MVKKFAILVAGGAGQRMSMEIPKQFLELKGLPILMHTIQAFYDYDPGVEIIVSIRRANLSFWKTICLQYHFKVPHTIVSGGRKRFDSVFNGLEAISGNGIVAIHDGVRPIIGTRLIAKSYEEAEALGVAVPIVRVHDSVRQFNEEGSVIVDRSSLRTIQTPQTFDVARLKEAYSRGYQEMFTDDASVWEAAGNRLHFIQGDMKNIKITRKEDLDLARILIDHR